MKIEQLFTGCLAEMAYYIESNGEAAIVDPLRETDPYIKMAEANGSKIKYIFLTHFHADFVSGHVDLAKKTGATIVFGPNAETSFDVHVGKDGEIFPLGDIKIKLLHTPGHTMESASYLIYDENGNTPYVLTGDCLFIGDVGRPDLAVKSDLTQADLAGHLYDSLRNKIMTLPDDIIVYPAHGAGSACGKNMSSETFDTLGNQKKTNYALRADMTKEEFIKEVTTGLKTPPQYFPLNVKLNKEGAKKSYTEIVTKGTTPLDAATFKELSEQRDIMVIDTRSKESYTNTGTIPGAWWIGLDGNFAPWVGTLIVDVNQKVIFIVDDEAKAHEAATRFSRIGFDNTLGYLAGGGLADWIAHGYPVDTIGSISAAGFEKKFMKGEVEKALDVRRESEYQSEHIIGFENFPLETIKQNFAEIDPKKEYYLHCASGYRSLIAASIFKANGVEKVVDIRGGFKDLSETDLPKSEYVCPTTLL
jgi:glyoxylase-like metal-dependent hydrolase (beta-lactamase superfamily II)/rhodanese-related sulfurtransferase